ncbi:recombinase family protein [Frankia sp. CiP3]|uniref:recombinase family protein n=1 Tax=Frankia sp. CiP3 TaxID=2880971 RepID=UPI001EF5D501|nr:recombinase family protein [Frankia sp. CiP3]
MRPFVYGYLRTSPCSSVDAIAPAQAEMVAYAEHEGYRLAEIFMDRGLADSSALSAAVTALRRGGGSGMIVPSPAHLASSYGVQVAMKEMIEREAGAPLFIVHPDSSRVLTASFRRRRPPLP